MLFSFCIFIFVVNENNGKQWKTPGHEIKYSQVLKFEKYS